MLELKTILCPTDFSDTSEAALEEALAIGRRTGAAVHVLHAVVLHADAPQVEGEPDLSRQAEETTGTVYRVERRGIAAGPVILAYANEIEADLIVMGTHGRRGLRHAILGSVAEEVVRLAECPVLTIRDSVAGRATKRTGPVVVPVDYSDQSAQSIEWAQKLAASAGASLIVLHVFERPIHPEVYFGGSVVKVPNFNELVAHLTQALQELAARADGPEVPTEFRVVEGRATRRILEFADSEQARLIVIATHGLTGLAHVLLGSVTERVVRGASCPVFTVKPSGVGETP